MVESNILITALDGPETRGFGGEAFGCRIVVEGASYADLSQVAVRWVTEPSAAARAVHYGGLLCRLACGWEGMTAEGGWKVSSDNRV